MTNVRTADGFAAVIEKIKTEAVELKHLGVYSDALVLPNNLMSDLELILRARNIVGLKLSVGLETVRYFPSVLTKLHGSVLTISLENFLIS